MGEQRWTYRIVGELPHPSRRALPQPHTAHPIAAGVEGDERAVRRPERLLVPPGVVGDPFLFARARVDEIQVGADRVVRTEPGRDVTAFRSSLAPETGAFADRVEQPATVGREGAKSAPGERVEIDERIDGQRPK